MDSWQPPSAGLCCVSTAKAGKGWEVWRRCRYAAVVCMQLFRVFSCAWDRNLFRWHWPYWI